METRKWRLKCSGRIAQRDYLDFCGSIVIAKEHGHGKILAELNTIQPAN